MIKRMLLQCACVVACLLAAGIAAAQQSSRYYSSGEGRMMAEDLLAQHFYALALHPDQKSGGARLPELYDGVNPEISRRDYIKIISSLKMAAPFAVDSALGLFPKLSAAPQRDRLSLAIAQYYFRAGKLAEAIPFYERAGIANLTNTEISDAKFERAYAYFNNRQFAKADTLFQIMKDIPGKYYSPGNYYHGLLAYNEGDFKAALKAFDRINNEPLYKPVVPYYMAEIYYFMGERDRALAEALRLIKRPEKLYYDNELHLLAAQCLFEAGRYGEALPYFEHYYEHTDKIRKEELYEMGYSYYRVNEWKSAIERFKPLSAAQDSLGQTAMYLLGDSYLKTGNKEAARNVFGVCAGMPFNAGQREASLLLHGKLSYELGYSDDAIRSVRTLLTGFPKGKYVADARLLQSQLYLQTSNYKDAYEALAAEGTLAGEEYLNARSRAAYGYALQEIQQQHLQHAGTLLDDVNNITMSASGALFWKGEIAYRLHHYDSAIYFMERYLAQNQSAADHAVNAANAALTLGYAALETKDFKKAQAAFAKARQNGGASSAANSATITLREADAYFMQKDFGHAGPLYASVATGNSAEADYARLQSAIIAGLRGDDMEKTRLLQSILGSSPPSPYATEARYELGVAQIAASRFQEAIGTLTPLTTDRSASAYAPKALLKIGTAQQQLDKDDAALEAYTRLLREWGIAPERGDALAAVKSIYIERNQPDAYTKLLADYHLPQASDAELDAAYYNAAEAQYAAGKWSGAATGFARYLQLYPSGASAAKARYYLATSLYNDKQFAAARNAYDTVLQAPWGGFSEESAKRAAELSDRDTIRLFSGRYYRMLAEHATTDAARATAFTGLMRAAAFTASDSLATDYADSLLTVKGVASAVRDEALLRVAIRALNAGERAKADSIMKPLAESTNGAVAAEARYCLAQNLLIVGKLKEAEDAASRNIKRSTGYELWVVKNYILLGDILIAEKDYFSARATLQSVTQHASFPELKAEAARKLESLKATEPSKLSND